MKALSKYVVIIGIGLVAALFSLSARAQQVSFADSAELFMPGLVSTKNADVKITFSPDGKKMLWGGIDWIEGKKDFDIWQSDKINGQWAKPERVSFDTDSNDFDPFFSPDGKGVYFFSNRAGGFGGDDIYFAAYDARTNTFANPVNIGGTINTPGNEWAPITDASAKQLIFSSNGHGGFGGQDLFSADILPGGFGKPVNLGTAVNAANDDFDAALLPGNILVFTSIRGTDQKADLYLAFKKGGAYNKVTPFPVRLGSKEFWTFGPSINFREPGYLYISAHLAHGLGRTDIYRVRYKVSH